MRVLSCCVALLVSVSAAMGQIGSGLYVDSTHRFQLKPAQHWSKGDAGLIDQVNGLQDSSNPYRTWTVPQVWLRRLATELTYPWIHVEVTPIDLTGWSFADVEKAFDSSTRSERAAALAKPLHQMVKEIGDRELLLDRSKRRLVYKFTGTDEANYPFTELGVGFLGRTGVVHLVFVGDSRQLDDYLPEFQKFVDSFQWDKGYEFVEGSPGAGTGGWTANRSEGQINAAAAKDTSASSKRSRDSERVRFGRGRIFGYGGSGVIGIIVLALLYRWMNN